MTAVSDEPSALEEGDETALESGGPDEFGESSGSGESEVDDGEDIEPDLDHPPMTVRSGDPAARCPYCGRPFRERRFETLHRGLEHPDRLSADEQTAFERAYLEERQAVRRYRLLALGAVVLWYFGMLMLYSIVI